MGSSKRQTTGYWYFMGMHMGLCHGPVDALLKIQAGGRVAWSGERYSIATNTLTGKAIVTQIASSEPVVENERIYINAENLFGGKKREGGVYGFLDVMMGEPDQGANDYLTAKQGEVQPAYRGILSVVYRGGAVAANNPYIKPWGFLVRRILKGWDTPVWYSAKASIDLGDGIIAMNPAHICYECLTNREWGLGYPSSSIDAATFATAADVFHAEGFGLCLKWAQQDSVQSFLQVVLDHVGAALGEDPRTGLWKMKAIRYDYDIDTLPEFSAAAGNIIALDQFERASGTDVFNELTVKYTDATTGEDGSITVQQLASIQSHGAIIPQTRTYAGLPTIELAARIASRDITAGAAGLARVRLTATRAAYGLLPGDVIPFSWPELGVEKMALRVGAVGYGNLTRGEITIEAVEDVFGLPLNTYIKPPPIGWVEPEREPQASTAVATFEAPYRDLVAVMGAANAEAEAVDAGYLASVARRPSGLSVDYELRTRIGSAEYAQVDDAEWTPTATLSIAATRASTLLTLAGAEDLDLVEMGSACLVGTEICVVTGKDLVAGTVTVGRGCCDTVPAVWPIGTRVWFYDTFAGADQTKYVATETINAKIITRTTGGELDEALAPGASTTMARRAARPYPPGLFRVNGESYPQTITGPLVVSWAHRDRVMQQDTLVDHQEASIGPEAGTTYVLRLYDKTGTLRRTESVTGTSYTWSTEEADSSLPYLNTQVRVRLHAQRDGLDSWNEYDITVQRVMLRLTEDGEDRITEDGEPRSLE